MTPLDADRLERALGRLHETDVEYASGRTDGLSNHGPMAVESLIALGGGERVDRFVAAYEKRLRPLPADVRARVDRLAARLGEDDWRPAARAMLVELLPAAVSSAAHGWLRTAHAIRALHERDGEVRRRELAFGLASWELRRQTLPGEPGRRPIVGRDVVRALAEVPLLAESERTDDGLIVDRVRKAVTVDGFAESVESVDLDALPFAAALSALAAAAARLFVATPGERFVYLHTLTATSACRLVAPLLDPALQRQALGAIFHAVAGLHATHGDARVARAAIEGHLGHAPAPVPEAIRARATESLDDHDIKLADAALREHAVASRPELLTAAGLRLRL